MTGLTICVFRVAKDILVIRGDRISVHNGINTAGISTAGISTAGINAAGIDTAGVSIAGINIAGSVHRFWRGFTGACVWKS